jgi:Kdo2-lipid IVA lauroyltransferase/acyltransferase
LASPRARAFRARLLYRALTLVASIGRRMSLARAQACGRFLGKLAWHVVRRERRKALANIAIAFPEWSETQRRDAIRKMFVHFGMSLFEIAWLPNLKAESLHETTHVEGIEPLRELIAARKPMLAITGHCGNWEWMAHATSLGGVPISVLQRERDEEEMNDFITELRAGAGIRTIDRGSDSSAREMIKALKGGQALCFLMDQSIRAESVKIPFFGRPAPTPIGPAKLAIRMEAAVAIGFIARGDDGLHRVQWLPPIFTSRDDDPVALLGRITEAVEAQVRRVPEQWAWMHDRWRERPKWDVTPGP